MRQQIATKAGNGTTGSSNILATSLYISPFNVGFGVVVSGTVTYTVQHTFDNVQTVASPTWFPHPTIAAKSDNQDGNYAFPVAAVKLVVTGSTGVYTATMTMIQAGIT
jgi:hypothetical protein